MFTVGQKVRVLEPFADSFPAEYEVTEVITHPDGQVAFILGDAGAFAAEYLETV
ncbi:MAG: hypothetical protein ACRCT2_01180 [Plesiomonas shigelloides]